MAVNHIQQMPVFELKTDPANTSARWTQWLECFTTYLIAANIRDPARCHALVLYQAGPAVYETCKTVPDTGTNDDYDIAVEKLTI